MSLTIINENDYYRKVYGGWMGKNIGGTLGAPMEGKKQLLDLTYYPVLPDGPLENDDLDLQLVWLHALEQYGARLSAKELGQEWLDHIFFPFDEYGYALTNLRRGLQPPVAGWFNNPFTNCMGSPIRSEIWAMASPAIPSVAAYYAYQDAIVDHAGGEGVYGEMFFAAIQSAAFVESDRDRLIELGLSFIPDDCRTALAVRDLLNWHREGKNWIEARSLILQHHGHSNFTDAPQNIAFTILGWLYGEDFGDSILKAVNCGYDTDCTGATLGAILGIIGGPESLPDNWVKPIGDRVVVSPPIKGFPAPANLDELTRRTIRVGKEVLAAWDAPVVVHADAPTRFAGDFVSVNDPAELWRRGFQTDYYPLPLGSKQSPSMELTIDYGADGPSIGRCGSKTIVFTLTNRCSVAREGTLRLDVPQCFKGPEDSDFLLEPGQSHVWQAAVTAGEDVRPDYPFTLHISRTHDNSPWHTESIPLSLVAATHWTLRKPSSDEGIKAVMPGNRVDFAAALGTSEAGIYRAATTLVNSQERSVRLIVATSFPVKATLNGQPLLEDARQTDVMPAYHRSPANKRAELVLPAGRHRLEIEVDKTSADAELDLFVLPVSLRQTKSPGPHYFFTDIVFV